MEPWYWFLTTGIALLGISGFAFSSRRYHARGRGQMTGGDVASGLLGLGLLAWAVVLAMVGGVIEAIRLLT